jgi:hypothetical protein
MMLPYLGLFCLAVVDPMDIEDVKNLNDVLWNRFAWYHNVKILTNVIIGDWSSPGR